MKRALMMIALAGALTSGCQDEFDSKTIIDGYRILGLQLDPPELRPDTAEVTVTAIDVNNEGATYSWSLCAISAGTISAFECFTTDELGIEDPTALGLPSEELEFPLPGDTAQITFNFQAIQGAVIGAFRTYVEDTCEGVEDVTQTILYRTQVQIFGANSFLKLTSGVEGDRVVQTAHALLIADNEFPANVNPQITEFTLDGDDADLTAPAGSEVVLSVALADGAREDYADFDTIEVQQECAVDCAVNDTSGCVNVGETTERITYTWYTTGGETDPPVTVWNDTTGNGNSSVITLPDEPGEIEVLIAVRDDRGGLDIERHTITVTAAE
ncbi:MAG: hypothetical protein ACE366_08210 [Bradymonadia bacterium]